MGFRFRKSVKLFPGVRLNLSKRGIGASVGVKGLHVSNGPSGPRMSASIPGTGLYVSESLKGKKRTTRRTRQQTTDQYAVPSKIRGAYYIKPWRAILGIFFLITTITALFSGLDLLGTLISFLIFGLLTLWLLFPWVKGILSLLKKTPAVVNPPPEGMDTPPPLTDD